jgi:hypothetical protein
LSTGANQRHAPEGDEAALDRVSSAPWFLRGRSIPFRVDCSHDIPYLGGIARDGRTVYVDRKAYPALVAQGVLPGLVEHERVEGILLRRGVRYSDAHRIATAAENRVYAQLGMDAEKAQAVYPKLVRSAEYETVTRCPKDLDLRPYSDPPADDRRLARIRKAQGS